MNVIVGVLRPVVSGPQLGPAFVDASQTTGEVAFASLRRQAAVVLSLIEPADGTLDPDALHDLRVAIRRTRAGIALFRNVLPARVDGLRRELAWLGGLLGDVRDLDVLIARLQSDPHNPALENLTAELERHRDVARMRLARAMATKRFERLCTTMIQVLRRSPPRRPEAAVPAVEAAPAMLEHAHARLVAAGESLGPTPSDEALHHLRIRVKRLRYALEFFAPIYGKRAKALIARTVEAQDALGAHQDAVVAARTLERLAVTRRLAPAAVFEAGRMARQFQIEADAARIGFDKRIARLSGRRRQRLWAELEVRRRSALGASAASAMPAATQTDTIQATPMDAG